MECKTDYKLVDYQSAMQQMDARVEAIIAGQSPGLLWLLEHPPLYTAGTSAAPQDLLNPQFPVHYVGRGGQFTYHGPGQRVAYLMLDLKQLFAPSAPDIRAYVQRLEQWLINSLAAVGVSGQIREGRVGVWVQHPTKGEAKIAALGIRVRKWVAFHGIALNIQPDLTHYAGIVPCGIRQFGVTSLVDMGINITMQEMDEILLKEAKNLHLLA